MGSKFAVFERLIAPLSALAGVEIYRPLRAGRRRLKILYGSILYNVFVCLAFAVGSAADLTYRLSGTRSRAARMRDDIYVLLTARAHFIVRGPVMAPLHAVGVVTESGNRPAALRNLILACLVGEVHIAGIAMPVFRIARRRTGFRDRSRMRHIMRSGNSPAALHNFILAFRVGEIQVAGFAMPVLRIARRRTGCRRGGYVLHVVAERLAVFESFASLGSAFARIVIYRLMRAGCRGL